MTADNGGAVVPVLLLVMVTVQQNVTAAVVGKLAMAGVR